MSKLKLNHLSKMKAKEMGALKGGRGVYITPSCGCACVYADAKGSSTSVNGSANHAGGLRPR